MSKWVFPEIHQGDVVLFASGPSDKNWTSAIVIKIGHEHVSCATFPDTSDNDAAAPHFLYSGVRHYQDPWLDDPNHREAVEQDRYMGVFKTTERHDKLQDLELRITALEKNRAASTPRKYSKGVKDHGEPVAAG